MSLTAVIAAALEESHDAGDCPHHGVDGEQQCPDCDAVYVARALFRWFAREGAAARTQLDEFA